MKVRLVVQMNAAPGKGAELAKAFEARCQSIRQEPGCDQFEIFQSAQDPDRFVLIELWADQAALDAHAEVNKTRAPLPPGLRAGPTLREDYLYAPVG